MYSLTLMLSFHLGKLRFPLVKRGLAGLRGFVVFMVTNLSWLTVAKRYPKGLTRRPSG